MHVAKKHIERFKLISDTFLKTTDVPKPNNWKYLSNNDIWLRFITQVMVVGSSAPAERFMQNSKLKRSVSYNKLSKIEDKKCLEKKINNVLREVGTRYASQSSEKCKKTQALVHNLKVLKKFKGGPKTLLQRISKFKGRNESKRKAKYLMKIFKYIKSKSARDFLMGLGLTSNAIALDVRLQNILKNKVGLDLSEGIASNPELYDKTEQELLSKVCVPLNLSGVKFDRILYQNYDKIKNMVLN